MPSTEFIDRLKLEKSELDTKIRGLQLFIISKGYPKINFLQQMLLPIQLEAMKTYVRVLNARLQDLVEEE